LPNGVAEDEDDLVVKAAIQVLVLFRSNPWMSSSFSTTFPLSSSSTATSFPSACLHASTTAGVAGDFGGNGVVGEDVYVVVTEGLH